MTAHAQHSRRTFAPSAAILLALAAATFSAGCDGPDEAQEAIDQASIRLNSFGSAGTAPLPTEKYRKDTYSAVISGLKTAVDAGTPAQQAAANLLTARGHAGMGEIAAQNAAELERRFLSQLTVARGALDQWVSQNSVADALKVYDPAKDLADLDTQIAARLADAEKLQSQKAAHERVVADIRSRAETAASAAKAKRSEEASVRKAAEGLSQTARLDAITRAAELGRAADKFDQESANLAAEAAKEAPRLDELQREIDRLKTQSELLRTAKADIQTRHTKSIEQSNAAREESKQAAAKLKDALNELATSRSALSGPTQEAIRAYGQAATAAKSAAKEAKSSAQFSAASYQQALGDLHAIRAHSLAAYAGTLDLIAKAKPAVPDLGDLASEVVRLTDEFKSAQEDAKKAYDGALSGYGASGSKVDEALLAKVKEKLAKLADVKQEPAPSDAAPDAGETPPADGGGMAAPSGDASANAAVEAEVRAAIESMKPDLESGDPARAIAHVHFNDPQAKAAIEGLIPLFNKGKDFNTACTEKFGKPFADLVKESQSPAIKSNPLLVQFGPFLSGGGGAAALPSADQYAKFLSPDVKINVQKPNEVELVAEGVAESITLIKVKEAAGAAWKINFDAGPGGLGMISAMAPMLKGVADVLDKVTVKTRDGGYPNADAMLLDLSAQLMGAMGAGMGAPGTPPPGDQPDSGGDDMGGGGGGG